MVSAKVVRCQRCGKRFRGQSGWNEDFIAGLTIGVHLPRLSDRRGEPRRRGRPDSVAAVGTQVHEHGRNTRRNGRVYLPTLGHVPDTGNHAGEGRSAGRRRGKDELASTVARVMREMADDPKLWGADDGND